MSRVCREQEKGAFTLVEALVATAILGTALGGILMAFSAVSGLIITSKDSDIAAAAAAGVMENISATPFININTTYRSMNFTVNGLPASRGRTYINTSNQTFLLATVVVCWRQGNRVIGEDQNLNGVLDAGEDLNNNSMIDSPAGLVTRIAP
jgi:hypothetical protein